MLGRTAGEFSLYCSEALMPRSPTASATLLVLVSVSGFHRNTFQPIDILAVERSRRRRRKELAGVGVAVMGPFPV